MIRIAIVGGGPSGVSVCMQLINKIKSVKLNIKIEIVIFEKNKIIGAGLPYADEEACHIFNLPKNVMEPMPGDTHLFANWLEAIDPNLVKTEFPPRHYFGKYLELMAMRTQKMAKDLGIKITYLTNHEVITIQNTESGVINLQTTRGNYQSNYLILGSGHMPSTTFADLIGNDCYIHNPWDMDVYKQIDPNASVGIIGSRLTAIDTALKLKKMNHQGKLYMVSRSGLLPAVLGKEVPSYTLKYLTMEALDELTQNGRIHLKAADFIELFWKELSEASGEFCDLSVIVQSSKDMAPMAWIEKEISESEKGARRWQQVLFSLYPLTPDIWPMFNFEDQQTFLKEYNSLFITYLAAFPLDNAYKIKNLLASGQLDILGDLNNVLYEHHQYTMHLKDGNTINTKYLFNATGPGYDPTTVPLYKKMLDQQIILKHSFGGIEVKTDTLQVINNNGIAHENIFAIGEITKGACFLTTDLSRVTAQGSRVVNHIVNQLFSEVS